MHGQRSASTSPTPTTLEIQVNGARHRVQAAPDTPLLYVLRNDLRLNGPKFGCGLAQCGACTVHLAGDAVRSCTTPVSAATSAPVTTIEGLAGTGRAPAARADGAAAGAAHAGASGARGAAGTPALGTAAAPPRLHALQQAFLDEQAAQCGYCLNGMIMSAAALLAKTPKPTEPQLREALAGNLCRCGSHYRILRAVRRAAGLQGARA